MDILREPKSIHELHGTEPGRRLGSSSATSKRGVLDETLVTWGGELGRDHHPRAFTVWLAAGGIKGGITVGATDDLGYNIVDDPVHVHDLHATVLHVLGLDPERLTYGFQGRDFRLMDVSGEIVQRLLA